MYVFNVTNHVHVRIVSYSNTVRTVLTWFLFLL